LNGVVQVTGTALANLRNASFSITNDTIEEFVCNGQITPALLAATGQHCEIKAEQLFTDNAILTAAQTLGTAVTINYRPKRHNNWQAQVHFHRMYNNKAGPKMGPEKRSQQQLRRQRDLKCS
jgi:hypothetical protein